MSVQDGLVQYFEDAANKTACCDVWLHRLDSCT